MSKLINCLKEQENGLFEFETNDVATYNTVFANISALIFVLTKLNLAVLIKNVPQIKSLYRPHCCT